jgi:hypothetical protein
MARIDVSGLDPRLAKPKLPPLAKGDSAIEAHDSSELAMIE